MLTHVEEDERFAIFGFCSINGIRLWANIINLFFFKVFLHPLFFQSPFFSQKAALKPVAIFFPSHEITALHCLIKVLASRSTKNNSYIS